MEAYIANTVNRQLLELLTGSNCPEPMQRLRVRFDILLNKTAKNIVSLIPIFQLLLINDVCSKF